jgi:hypothetical protein
MKPLFARFIPAIVSEQPVSARENARLYRGMTGVGWLLDTEVGEVEGKPKEDDDGRRDTAVAMSVSWVTPPGRIWDPKRGSKAIRRSW